MYKHNYKRRPKKPKAWSKKDLIRIEEKVKDLFSEIGTITFKDVDELGMLLDEEISPILRESLLRLAESDKICLIKKVIFDKEHPKNSPDHYPPYEEWWLDYIPF